MRDAWYAVAFSTEVGDAPAARRILDEPIVLYRTTAGRIVALGDACPHRNAPLSLGNVKGDAIQCLYHGFEFGADGGCIKVSSQEEIPSALRTPAFPVQERDNVVWVWVGDPAKAASTPLVSFPWPQTEGLMTLYTQTYVKAPVALLIDNLMDLTHIHFMHKVLGADLFVHESEMDESVQENGTVRYTRILNKTTPDKPYLEIGGRYTPPSLCETWAVPRMEGVEGTAPGPVSLVLHMLTPASETEVRYLGMKCIPYTDDSEKIAAVQHQMDVTLEEDRMMCEAVWELQCRTGGAVKEIPVRADRSAMMARRIYEKIYPPVAPTPERVQGNGNGHGAVADLVALEANA